MNYPFSRISFFLLSALFLFVSCRDASTLKKGFIPSRGDGQLYYEEKGSGEPVVFLHGHSLDTRMWDKQFNAFARAGLRVVRLDFRGYGRSSEQSETFQQTHLDDVLTVMDSLRIGRAHIVGLSMGAFVAAEMIAMCPERLISCTLASGSLHGSLPGPSEPMDSVESAQRDKEIAELQAKGVDVMKAEWLEALMKTGGTESRKMRKPLKRMIDDWSAWQPLHKEPRVLYGRDAQRVLEKRRSVVPTLFLSGENEHRDKVPSMSRWLDDYRYVILPNCGHMLNMDQPKAFNDTVLDFILSHPDTLSPARFGALQTGDLVFVTRPRNDNGADTIHVATLDVQADGIYVVDATLKHGVDRHPLDTLFSDFTRHNGSICDMYVMRLRDNSDAFRWIASAVTFTGEPYDIAFQYDNGMHYCSELVQDCYLTDEGTPLFPTTTMDFRDADGTVSDYWQRLFTQMQMPVPQGVPGISPADISRSEQLVPVPVDILTFHHP